MRWFGVLLLLAVVGCSSLENVGLGLEGHNPQASCRPFGGVQSSTERVTEGVDSIRRSGLQFYIPVMSECIAVCVLADIPLSAVGDVVTLPYCLYRTGPTVSPAGPPADLGSVGTSSPANGGMP